MIVAPKMTYTLFGIEDFCYPGQAGLGSKLSEYKQRREELASFLDYARHFLDKPTHYIIMDVEERIKKCDHCIMQMEIYNAKNYFYSDD
jgi:hypothetical protein